MALGQIAEIWRYPVNGLQGEKLTQGQVFKTGIAGDHVYALRSKELDRIIDPKSDPASLGGTASPQNMLEFAASLSGDPVGDHEIIVGTTNSGKNPGGVEAISTAIGHSVELVRNPRIVEARVRAGRTIHLLTSASLGQMRRAYPAGDFDARRFRPNILVKAGEGLEGCVEDEWVGKELSLGKQVRLLVGKVNERCRLTTMKQAGVKEDAEILHAVQRENGSNLGVMCTVVTEGLLRVGDAVSLL